MARSFDCLLQSYNPPHYWRFAVPRKVFERLKLEAYGKVTLYGPIRWRGNVAYVLLNPAPVNEVRKMGLYKDHVSES